jgi:hypothetical protein
LEVFRSVPSGESVQESKRGIGVEESALDAAVQVETVIQSVIGVNKQVLAPFFESEVLHQLPSDLGLADRNHDEANVSGQELGEPSAPLHDELLAQRSTERPQEDHDGRRFFIRLADQVVEPNCGPVQAIHGVLPDGLLGIQRSCRR